MAAPAPFAPPLAVPPPVPTARDFADSGVDEHGGAPLLEALIAPPSRPSRLGLVDGSQTLFLVAAGLTLAAIAGALVSARLGQAGWARVLDNVHWSVADLAAAALAWLGVRDARRKGLRPELAARRWFALGFSSYALGQMFWNVQVVLAWQPFPAPSDPFYMLFSPCIAAGFVTVLRERVGRPQRLAALLDTLSLAIAVVALALVAYLPERGETTALALGVMVAYPTLLLATACVGLMLAALQRTGARWSVWALLAMLAAHGALWMEWNALTLAGALSDGGLVNVAFSACTLVGGLAASTWRLVPSESARLERFYEGALRLLPLVVVVGVATAVLMQDSVARLAPAARTLGGSAAVVVILLAMFRQSLLLRDRALLVEAQRRLREHEEQLEELNHRLEQRVVERTQEAERRNAELATALQQLSAAQRELARAERLAGVGSLVEGVAGELGTALGNARMVAATLPAQHEALARTAAGESGGGTLAAMAAALATSHAQLALALDQAQHMVAGFHRVAVDQASEQRRDFDLLETVREIVELARLAQRQRAVEIVVTGEPGLVLDSYPGPIAQVLGQLIENAVLHGLRDGREGAIAVRVWPTVRDDVRITVQDDGVGIPPGDVAEVFAPFFTTRGAQGSAGLGLTLCRQIVNGVLGGRIELVSPPDAGTTVTLTLPRRAPRQPA
jgi:signal transduction histidine kinase